VSDVLTILLIFGLICGVLYGIFYLFSKFVLLIFLAPQLLNFYLFRKTIFIQYSAILDPVNPYFHSLSPEGKRKFVFRTFMFIQSKTFVGKDGLEVDTEKQVRIAASAIQITFHLKNFLLPHFHTIHVHPDIYHYGIDEREFKGSTSPAGIIALSWKHFTEGYSEAADRINLGIHEMAHALELDAIIGNDTDLKFAKLYDEWNKESDDEFEMVKEEKLPFLRPYGGTNKHEFFAVCLEEFFEAPAEFKNKLPELYEQLCLLLNQNPLNVDKDYELTNE